MRERRPRGQEEGDEQEGAVSRGYGVRRPLLVQRLHVKERGKSPADVSQRREVPLKREERSQEDQGSLGKSSLS